MPVGGAGVLVAPAQARGWGRRTWTSNEDPPLCPRVPLRQGGLRSIQDGIREGPDASGLGSSRTLPGLRCRDSCPGAMAAGAGAGHAPGTPIQTRWRREPLPQVLACPCCYARSAPQTLPSTPVRVAKPSSELLTLTPLSLGLSHSPALGLRGSLPSSLAPSSTEPQDWPEGGGKQGPLRGPGQELGSGAVRVGCRGVPWIGASSNDCAGCGGGGLRHLLWWWCGSSGT